MFFRLAHELARLLGGILDLEGFAGRYRGPSSNFSEQVTECVPFLWGLWIGRREGLNRKDVLEQRHVNLDLPHYATGAGWKSVPPECCPRG